jgi:hypothetical protein
MKTVHFDGPCPFLLCLVTEPHDHQVCPEHGTVSTTVEFKCFQCRMTEINELERIAAL